MEYEIHTYGGSQRGRSHDKNGKPCQDNSYVGCLSDNPNIAILIVADGVGSAAHSEEGSQIAVSEVKFYLENDKLPITPEKIRDAYTSAFESIKKHSEENTNNLPDYDTTLSVAVFNAETGSITYGHSGDGAILAIRQNGINESITKPQKGMDVTSVMPLRDTNAWVFGTSDGPYVSVMAMTDGVLDLLMPGRLKMTSEPVYVRLTSWLADMKFFDESKDLEEQFAQRLSYVRSDVHKGITNDDLTFICAINTKVKAEYRDDEYYKEPDWKALEEAWRKKAYPTMYDIQITVDGAPLSIRNGKCVADLPIPVKDGFSFIGWYADEKCKKALDVKKPLVENRAYYSKWQKNSVEIIVDGQPMMVKANSLLQSLPIKNEGRAFIGWFSDDACTSKLDPTLKVTEGSKYYSKYAEPQVEEIKKTEQEEPISSQTLEITQSRNGCVTSLFDDAKHFFEEGNKSEEKKKFDEAIKTEDPFACYEYALNCVQQSDFQGAFKLMSIAKQKGCPEAINYLDSSKIEYFDHDRMTVMIAGDDLLAILFTARHYESEKVFDKAKTFYEKAANLGSTEATEALKRSEFK